MGEVRGGVGTKEVALVEGRKEGVLGDGGSVGERGGVWVRGKECV